MAYVFVDRILELAPGARWLDAGLEVVIAAYALAFVSARVSL